MTLYILNAEFNAQSIIEKYESLIWTERWQEEGDFELRIYPEDVAAYGVKLNQWLGMSDTHQIMKVETLNRTRNADGKKIYIFKGHCGKSIFRARSALDTNIYRYSWGARKEGPSYERFDGWITRTNLAPSPRFNKEGNKTDDGSTNPIRIRSNSAAKVSMGNDGMRVEGASETSNASFAHLGDETTRRWSPTVIIQPGKWIGIDCWVVADDPLSGTLHDNYATIQFYQVVGGTVQRSGSPRPDGYYEKPTRQRIVTYVDANATAAYLRFYCGAMKDKGWVYWNDLLVVQGDTEAEVRSKLNDGPFDGDSTHFERNPDKEFEYSKSTIIERILTETVLNNTMAPYENINISYGTPSGIPGYTVGAIDSQSGNTVAVAKFGDNLYDLITNTAIAIDQGWAVFRSFSDSVDEAWFVTRVRGTDRRLGASQEIVIGEEYGNLTSSDFFESYRNTYNLAAVYHKNEMFMVNWEGRPGQYPETTGLNRRILPVDASSIEMDKGDRRMWITLAAAGLNALHKNGNRIFAADGEVQLSDSLVYEKHFGLGSLVTFVIDEGISYAMRITEYTFVDDDQGYRSYPTFKYYSSSWVAPVW